MKGEERPRCLLLGSGEYETWAEAAERQALSDSTGDGSVALLATASAPEGDTVFGRWNALGVEHYARLGISARVIEVRTRADARDPAWAEAVQGCSMIFFSGGNPGYLAQTVGGTALWDAIRAAISRGATYGGCSAGAMVAGAPPTGRPGRFTFNDSMTLIPEIVFGVHWDSPFMRAARMALVRRQPAGTVFMGIPERTALYVGRSEWRVFGRAALDVRGPRGRSQIGAGTIFSPPI